MCFVVTGDSSRLTICRSYGAPIVAYRYADEMPLGGVGHLAADNSTIWWASGRDLREQINGLEYFLVETWRSRWYRCWPEDPFLPYVLIRRSVIFARRPCILWVRRLLKCMYFDVDLHKVRRSMRSLPKCRCAIVQDAGVSTCELWEVGVPIFKLWDAYAPTSEILCRQQFLDSVVALVTIVAPVSVLIPKAVVDPLAIVPLVRLAVIVTLAIVWPL